MTLIFALHELICMTDLLYLYPDLTHNGGLLQKWFSTWNQTTKRCIPEKSNSIDQVSVQKGQMQYRYVYAVWMSLNKNYSTIWNKNDSFVLHELPWLICFISTLSSSIFGTSKEMVINLKPNNKKVAYLRSQTPVKVQESKCSTDEFMQYRSVLTENCQQSGIKMTHLYCMSWSDKFAFVFVSWPHIYWGTFTGMFINLKPNNKKFACLKSQTTLTRSMYQKSQM